MKILRYIPLMLLTGCTDHSSEMAEDALRNGNEQYRSEEYDAALRSYDAALFDPRVRHNAGKAAYKAGDHHAATEHLTELPDLFADAQLKAHAYHDLGNARYMQSRSADSTATSLSGEMDNVHAGGQDIAGRIRAAMVRDSLRNERQRMLQLVDSALNASIEAYKNALRLAPADEDTRHNLAMAIDLRKQKETERREKEDKENEDLSERAKQLLALADRLVEEYKFKEAFEVLTTGLQEDPTLQQKKEYMDKLQVVTKAAEAR